MYGNIVSSKALLSPLFFRVLKLNKTKEQNTCNISKSKWIDVLGNIAVEGTTLGDFIQNMIQ